MEYRSKRVFAGSAPLKMGFQGAEDGRRTESAPVWRRACQAGAMAVAGIAVGPVRRIASRPCASRI